MLLLLYQHLSSIILKGIKMNLQSKILCIISAIILVSCQSRKEEAEKKLRLPVTSPLQKDTLVYKEYVCQIRAINHIEIRSQEKGYLQNVYVDEGQFIHKGQSMFRIMPMIYEAEVQKSQAEVDHALIEYENTLRLADSNIVSKNEVKLALANLNKEKANLSLAKTHLSFTNITAPFDGYMDRFQERLGSLIDEGTLLTTLSDNSNMWVYFNVPESEYLDFKLHGKDQNNTVKLRLANNELFSHMGKVETIEADFNNETGNIAFRALFPNPEKILRHGETGNILMPVNLNQAIIIPQKSTFEILDKKYVYVLDEKNILHSRAVTVGAELPHYYVITSGLGSKDKILLEGMGKVNENMQIEAEYKPFEKVVSEINDLHAE